MSTTPEGKDEALWEIAKKRAGFQKHLMTYIIINSFLWAIWFFTRHSYSSDDEFRFPWPLWSTLGWGIGLAFNFAGAYIFHSSNSIEKEYQKLKNRQ